MKSLYILCVSLILLVIVFVFVSLSTAYSHAYYLLFIIIVYCLWFFSVVKVVYLLPKFGLRVGIYSN